MLFSGKKLHVYTPSTTSKANEMYAINVTITVYLYKEKNTTKSRYIREEVKIY